MSKTVLETKEKSEEEVVVEKKRKTMTNWRVLEEVGFLPARVKCDGYKGTHPGDLSCHTAFPPSVENIVRHASPEHGGGWFRIKFRVSDTKKSDLWKGLEDAGLECKEFWCPHCDQVVPMSPRRILYHLNPHPGRTRVNLDPQVLCMWLGNESLEDVDELEDLYES